MAEEIGYSIVGEQEKQLSNVVDYNIREEQTKDTFNTDNANNQTTTGMANVIPGINAPKLIADTSIIGGSSGGSFKIIEVSDYQSIDEWQPIVTNVLEKGEWVVVKCKFPPHSNLQYHFFTPCYYLPDQMIRFGATYVGTKRFRINCWVTGSTITSMTSGYGDWNTNA